MSLDKVINSVKALSTVDKVKLIKQVTLQIEQELKTTSSTNRKSLRGLWRDLEITDEDIREVW